MRWKEAVLFCFSVLIAIGVAEVAARIYLALPNAAIALTTMPAMAGEEGDVVRYEPSSLLREVAVDEIGIIYDAVFETNNLGLIDERDYELSTARPAIALLGDSFTAGYHGGSPWIVDFRSGLAGSVDAFNLGVAGTGIVEFEKRLQWFTEKFEVDELYVLFISSDMYRLEWFPVMRAGKLWFCPSGTPADNCVANQAPAFHELDSSWSDDALLHRAAAIMEGNRSAPQSGFQLYRLFRSIVGSLRESPALRLTYPQVQANLGALERLVKQFGADRTVVLHLPEKHEVANGGYDIDLTEFGSRHSIKYVQLQQVCPFTPEMYLARDPHPNALGYGHLVRCLLELRGIPAR